MANTYLDWEGLQAYHKKVKAALDTKIEGVTTIAGKGVGEGTVSGKKVSIKVPTKLSHLEDTDNLVSYQNKGKDIVAHNIFYGGAEGIDPTGIKLQMKADGAYVTDQGDAAESDKLVNAYELDEAVKAAIKTNVTDPKGVAGGFATLDETGKVPSSQLPSYVDDVVEYANKAAFPGTGEAGKIYVAKDTNVTYRWGGTAYVEISASLAIGVTTDTAFEGSRGYALERAVNNSDKGLDKKAQDDKVVHIAGPETITGDKTFMDGVDVLSYNGDEKEKNEQRIKIDSKNCRISYHGFGEQMGDAGNLDLRNIVAGVSVSGSGNGVASVEANGNSISVTKANFLTEHQPLDNYVDLTSQQVISGYKIFSADEESDHTNPTHMKPGYGIKIKGLAGDASECYAKIGVDKVEYVGAEPDGSIMTKEATFYWRDLVSSVAVSGAGNAVTGASINKNTLTLTKGKTFLTEHQSLDNCVKLTGIQTITGQKTFNGGLTATNVVADTVTGKTVKAQDVIASNPIYAELAPKTIEYLTDETGYNPVDIELSKIVAGVTTTGNGNAVTGITFGDNAITVTKGTTFQAAMTRIDEKTQIDTLTF